MISFISGPMRGYPDLNHSMFDKAESLLRTAYDRKVLNPCILPTDLPDKAYIPIDLAMLDQADEIVMLPGWNKSLGANTEFRFAEMRGKHISYIVEKDGNLCLMEEEE